MKWPIAVLVAGFAVPAGAVADDAAKADLAKLEGTWDVVSIEAGGMKMPAGQGGPEKAVIKDGVATFFAQGKAMPTFKDLKLQLDPKKKPKAVDLVRGGKEILPCIYEVTDDGLKLAMPLVPLNRKPQEPLPRPESFDSKGQEFIVLTAKRGKS
jgi:uncharacterized protein (TIGR03067 family)